MKKRFILVTVLVFALDRLTKYLASTTLSQNRSIEIIPGYLGLSYVTNSGVAFGFFHDLDSVWKPYLLGGLAIVAVIVIIIYSSHMPAERALLQVSLAVTMGGILGNFADRLLHGSVVDFIEFHVRDSFHWPTFNLADSAITIGIAMLLLDTLMHPDRATGRGEADSVQQ